MLASLRFFDRYGFRLWCHFIIGQITLAIALFLPTILVFQFFHPAFLFQGKEFISQTIASPSIDMIIGAKNHILGFGMSLSGFLLLLLCWLYLSFSTASFFGTIGSAAVEQRISIGRYFSRGFLYFLPFSGLLLILISTFLVLTGAFSVVLSFASSYRLILLPVIIILYLLFFMVTNNTLAVIFVDQTSIFQGIREGLRISFQSLGKAAASFFQALTMGLLGLIGITVISLLPFITLQFLPDHTLSLIASSFLGMLLLLLFSPFPLILFTSTLFFRYVEVRKKKQGITSGMPTSSTS